jgi:hypothetical protein
VLRTAVESTNGSQFSKGFGIAAGTVGGDGCCLPNNVNPARTRDCYLSVLVGEFRILVEEQAHHNEVPADVFGVLFAQGTKAGACLRGEVLEANEFGDLRGIGLRARAIALRALTVRTRWPRVAGSWWALTVRTRWPRVAGTMWALTL